MVPALVHHARARRRRGNRRGARARGGWSGAREPSAWAPPARSAPAAAGTAVAPARPRHATISRPDEPHTAAGENPYEDSRRATDDRPASGRRAGRHASPCRRPLRRRFLQPARPRERAPRAARHRRPILDRSHRGHRRARTPRASTPARARGPHAPSATCTFDASDPELPVSCVHWRDADAYCRFAGKRLADRARVGVRRARYVRHGRSRGAASRRARTRSRSSTISPGAAAPGVPARVGDAPCRRERLRRAGHERQRRGVDGGLVRRVARLRSFASRGRRPRPSRRRLALAAVAEPDDVAQLGLGARGGAQRRASVARRTRSRSPGAAIAFQLGCPVSASSFARRFPFGNPLRAGTHPAPNHARSPRCSRRTASAPISIPTPSALFRGAPWPTTPTSFLSRERSFAFRVLHRRDLRRRRHRGRRSEPPISLRAPSATTRGSSFRAESWRGTSSSRLRPVLALLVIFLSLPRVSAVAARAPAPVSPVAHSSEPQPAVASAIEPGVPQPVPASTIGTLRVDATVEGQRVFVDGVILTAPRRCSGAGRTTSPWDLLGRTRTIDVPCGGEVTVYR